MAQRFAYDGGGVKFQGLRTAPIAKDITNGGLTTTGPGPWMMLEAGTAGYKLWKFTVYNGATAYSVDIEGTDDYNNILCYPGGAMRSNKEGQADIGTISPYVLIEGITQDNLPYEYARRIIAVRANVKLIGSGTLKVWGTAALT